MTLLGKRVSTFFQIPKHCVLLLEGKFLTTQLILYFLFLELELFHWVSAKKESLRCRCFLSSWNHGWQKASKSTVARFFSNLYLDIHPAQMWREDIPLKVNKLTRHFMVTFNFYGIWRSFSLKDHLAWSRLVFAKYWVFFNSGIDIFRYSKSQFRN